MRLTEHLDLLTESAYELKEVAPDEPPTPVILCWRGDRTAAMIHIGEDASGLDDIVNATGVAAEGFVADVVGICGEALVQNVKTSKYEDAMVTTVANRAGDVAFETRRFHVGRNGFGLKNLIWEPQHRASTTEGGSPNGDLVTYLRELMLDHFRPTPETFRQWAADCPYDPDDVVTQFMLRQYGCLIVRPEPDDGLHLYTPGKASDPQNVEVVADFSARYPGIRVTHLDDMPDMSGKTQ